MSTEQGKPEKLDGTRAPEPFVHSESRVKSLGLEPEPLRPEGLNYVNIGTDRLKCNAWVLLY
jgi:hypothetical protein